MADLVMGSAVAAVADVIISRSAGNAAGIAATVPLDNPQQQQQQQHGSDPSVDGDGPLQASTIIYKDSQQALVLMARVLRADAKAAIAAAAVRLAHGQLRAVQASGSKATLQQQQQRQQEAAAAEAAAIAAAAAGSDESALLRLLAAAGESGEGEGVLMGARQSILALAAVVAPAAATVVAGVGAPLPPSFAGRWGFSVRG